VQPSSLVFALVVGLWAAYLLPQWVRRRESLGHSRVYDRHSQRLRVLPRRRPSPSATGPSSRPLLPVSRVDGVPPVRAGARAQARPKALPDVAPVAGRGLVARGASAALAARRRAVVLVGLVLVTAVGWVVVALPSPDVAGWVGVPASVVLGLDLLALRTAARSRARRAARVASARRVAEIVAGARESAARGDVPADVRSDVRPDVRADGQAGGQAGGRADVRPDRARMPGRPVAPMRTVARTAGPRATPAERPLVRPTVRPSARPEVAAATAAPAGARGWDDRRWEDETGEIVGVERHNPLTPDDGWAPVAVPTPAYLLKPVIPRRPPVPWTAERDFADDLDLDAVLARRRAVNG
jgi:hypothetical protein